MTYLPWWGVGLLVAALLVETVLVARWARDRPPWCVAVPAIGFVVWLAGALTLG